MCTITKQYQYNCLRYACLSWNMLRSIYLHNVYQMLIALLMLWLLLLMMMMMNRCYCSLVCIIIELDNVQLLLSPLQMMMERESEDDGLGQR